MNLRKSRYFKMLCLAVAILFTVQCFSIKKSLISTEKRVIENEIHFVYEFEKIKTPSAQSPIVEYKIIKFPADKVETINKYVKVKKPTHLPLALIAGTICGLIGRSSAAKHIQDPCADFLDPPLGFIGGFSLGFLGTAILSYGINNKKTVLGEFEVPKESILIKKPGSIPIMAPNIPLEFKWMIKNKIFIFKTNTDDQGIVKLNLINDLNMINSPSVWPSRWQIYYINTETQAKELFMDSLME